MAFANTLRELRISRKITQEELAKYLNVSRPTIAGYETKNKQPDFEKLKKIAAFFDVSIDYLITGNSDYDSPGYKKGMPQIDEDQLFQSLDTQFHRLSYRSQLDLVEYAQLLNIRDRCRAMEK